QAIPTLLELLVRRLRPGSRRTDGDGDKAIDLLGSERRREPRHTGAPIVPDDVRPLDAERVENAGHLPNDGGQPIIRGGRRIAAAATAAQVGDAHADAALGERGEVVAPQMARVRKAAQPDDLLRGGPAPDL